MFLPYVLYVAYVLYIPYRMYCTVMYCTSIVSYHSRKIHSFGNTYFNVRFDILPLLNEKLALQYINAKGDDVVVLDVLIFYFVFGF